MQDAGQEDAVPRFTFISLSDGSKTSVDLGDVAGVLEVLQGIVEQQNLTVGAEQLAKKLDLVARMSVHDRQVLREIRLGDLCGWKIVSVRRDRILLDPIDLETNIRFTVKRRKKGSYRPTKT